MDCLTIDYRKTLNDYKIKIMEDLRKKASKTNMNLNTDKKKSYNENPEKSFVEILKGDHTRESH